MKSTYFKLLASIVCVAAIAGAGASAPAAPLLGCGIGDGFVSPMIYDVAPATGLASNPRQTGTGSLIGLAFSPQGLLYGVSTFAGEYPNPNLNSLYEIDPVSGASRRIGDTGLQIAEGDLAFHPTTGVLYALSALFMKPEVNVMFTIDLGTGAGTVVGNIEIEELNESGMAFDPSGRLYVLDTYWDQLLTVDPSDADVLDSVPLSLPLGSVVGMDLDPDTGILYVADGRQDGTDSLYTLDPATGVLTQIGHTGLEDGLAGLVFIPEPGALLILPGGMVLRRKKRASPS